VITAVKGSEADHVTVRTALLSVSDKEGLVQLGAALAARGVTVRARVGGWPPVRRGVWQLSQVRCAGAHCIAGGAVRRWSACQPITRVCP
jgi:AICAR transformylase/IMP cyclohydrolase PurH